jgi:RNA polymerase-binding transcription factor DksA
MKPRSKPMPGRSRRRTKARTDEIIPRKNRVSVPRKWRVHYCELLAFRDQLLKQKTRLATAAREEKPTFSEHMADAGTDHYDRDFALSLLSSEQNALYEIEQALNRIFDGTYGKCELTNKPIPIARLKAIPWTRFSTDAERQLEQIGSVEKVKLAAVHGVPREDTSKRVAEREEG